jgi:erythritol transport system ATP-binding protein
MNAAAATPVILEARNVSKVFGGTAALSNVDFAIGHGHVHALIGENGAGKSTLVKMLAGVERPTSGTLVFDGQQVELSTVRDATNRGITLIHQELQLFPDLSVVDNVFMGHERLGRWQTVDRRSQEAAARDTLAILGQRLDPRTRLGSLPLAARQMVEIARALVRDTRVLLMDEPTSALSPAEVAVLFGVIRRLTTQGVAIVYISHRLQELLAIADTVTVLRDGRVAGAAATSTVDVPWIVERMTGRPTSAGMSTTGRPAGRVVLSVTRLGLPAGAGRAALDDVSFTAHAGDVIGIYGSMGAGRTELLETLIGLHADATGHVEMDGQRVDRWSVDRRLATGMAMVPEDRQHAGLVPAFSIRQNLTLSSLPKFTHGGCLSVAREDQAAQDAAAGVRLKAPSLDAAVTTLSGGNQQKVIIGRALMSRPKVLLMDEPSRGVDVSARADILQGIRQLANDGMAIVFTSSDLDEIRAASTKVIVLSRGRVAATFDGEAASEADIAAAASAPVACSAQESPWASSTAR